MLAIVDGDIVTFSCAIFNENWGWAACREDIDALMKRILETSGADDSEIYITGTNNFRYDINPDYKANRADKPDPIYRNDANAYLVEHFGARVTDGWEADDAAGISASRYPVDERVLCSIDKDWKQIEGTHYNWRKNEFSEVSPLDGIRLFYRQLLTGDSVDGIPGVGGIGKVKSARIIDDLIDEIDMFNAAEAFYTDPERMVMIGRCLWILRSEDDNWEDRYNTLKEKANSAIQE